MLKLIISTFNKNIKYSGIEINHPLKKEDAVPQFVSQGNIVQRIEELREVLDLQKKDFCEQIDFSKTNYTNITGQARKSKPPIELIAKILAKFTNVNPSWLVKGSGELFLPNHPPQNQPTLSKDQLLKEITKLLKSQNTIKLQETLDYRRNDQLLTTLTNHLE